VVARSAHSFDHDRSAVKRRSGHRLADSDESKRIITMPFACNHAVRSSPYVNGVAPRLLEKLRVFGNFPADQ